MKKQFLSNPYLRIIFNPQAYKNLAYLLLTFPTGLLYFVLLIIGSALGFGLSVIGVGLLILWGTFVLGQFGARLERNLANNLLGANIAAPETSITSLSALGEGHSWRAILFLFLKFPLGILSFTLTMIVISTILGIIATPFTYSTGSIIFGFREIDTLWEALIASAFGIILLPLALILLGKMAQGWRNFATGMLQGAPHHEKQKRAATASEIMERLMDDEANDAEVAYYEEEEEEASKGLLTG